MAPSAWRKASKISSCCSAAMPMPVSLTAKLGCPSSSDRRRVTWPCSVNLKALDSSFLRICSTRWRSLKKAGGIRASSSTTKATPLFWATARRRSQGFHQAAHGHLLWADLQHAGLDLGDVEDVVDQGQQVIARRIVGFGVAHLLAAEVDGRVVRQQLGQDQRAVQRCAQFMGHVRQEFGLVLAGRSSSRARSPASAGLR